MLTLDNVYDNKYFYIKEMPKALSRPIVDLGSIHTHEKDQPFFTKGWSSREIGMLASITDY